VGATNDVLNEIVVAFVMDAVSENIILHNMKEGNPTE